MIKVTHVIADLSPGGAETMLYRVISRMDSARFRNEVISLTDLGSIASKIQASGVSVRALGMKRGFPNPFLFLRLVRWIRGSEPQIVQTWMYHADLIGGLAACFASQSELVWNIRQANLDPEWNRTLTIWIAKVCAVISRWLPERILSCSRAALLVHAKLGYATSHMEVVPNGFDLDEFKPDPRARLSLRRELGLPEDALIIGMAARFHPVKGHRNFIRAAARLRQSVPEVHFALCGAGIDHHNSELSEWITAMGLGSHCHLLGVRQDLPRLFAAMDIFTSPSLSEAFPSVVGEAMACGTPCVVTDVGDSALVVGESGRVVPPADCEALAEAWLDLVKAGPKIRQRLGMAARSRVSREFSISSAVESYQRIYTEVAGGTDINMHSTGLATYAE